MNEINRIIRNLCSNASFAGGTVSASEVDDFLMSHSDIYFCHGRMFKVVFQKVTDRTFKIKREWL